MPRVHTKTKSTRGKVYKCQTCSLDIEPGQDFYEWSRRYGRSGVTYRQHVACGRPRPTQLSSRKTAVLEEAVNAADFSGWNFEVDPEEFDLEGGTIDMDISELETMIEEIADVAREIAQEYQDGHDNMPEGLQQGEVGQAMEDVAQELESWADDLVTSAGLDDTDFSYDSFTYDDQSEISEEDQEVGWREDVSDELAARVEELRNGAMDAIGEYPEYQG